MTIQSNTAKFLLFTALTSHSLFSFAEEKFKVCADPVNPPYSMKDQSGYENKIAALFAEQLGQTLEYTWLPDRIGFIRNTLKAENDNSQGYKCDVVIGVPLGSELTDTTKAYLHTSYILLIAKGRGWDDINSAKQLTQLEPSRQEKIKIAMFDRGPGTEWLQKNGLLDQGIPYQSMTGDSQHNTAMKIDQDLRSGLIDMVILWGPMASYVQSQSPDNAYKAIPMQSEDGIKFDFSISMGVRQSDGKRKQLLNELIEKNQPAIANIIAGYHILQLPIPAAATKKADD